MGFRFQKRITLLPGVRMNPGKSGASLSVGPRGACVIRNITQKDLAALCLGHVSPLILRLIGHSFSVSSGIRSVAVSAYTRRSGSTGRVDDEYVAVAEIDRNGWNQVDCPQMSAIDPENLLRRFGAKIEVNSRGILKIQQPFE